MTKPWLNSYPQGVPHTSLSAENQTLLDYAETYFKKHASLPAYTNMGTGLSFQELDELSKQFASFLQNTAKVQPGDRVALQMPNVLQYPVALFGAIRAGAVVVNVNPLYTEREMEHQLKDSGAKVIVVLANFANKLEKILGRTEIKTVVTTQVGDLLGAPKSWLVNGVLKYVKKMVPAYNLPKAYSFWAALDEGQYRAYRRPEVKTKDIALLQYTGGTTGVSKGAILTHHNVISNITQISDWGLGRVLAAGQDSVVTPLPLYHIFALTVSLLMARFGVRNLLITNPRDIPGFIKTLNKESFSVMTGVNTLFNALLQNAEFKKLDFSKLKLTVGGGMAVQVDVSRRWKELTGSPIYEGYGLTEASPVLSFNPLDEKQNTVGSIGLPLPSTDVGIFDDAGKLLPLGEPGELYARGPQVMQGYWQRPDETNKVLTQEGWLKTGDIAVMQENGFLKIVDRKKDMILVSGFNVFPNEIEDVATQHPSISEAAAVGEPDDKSGEVVKLFVVLVKGQTLTSQQVIDFCRKQLTGYKVPKLVEFVNELPKTNVGKILRRALRHTNKPSPSPQQQAS